MQGKKKALGRGLSALLEGSDLPETPREFVVTPLAGMISMISIEDIEGNPYQPRTDFDRAELADLAISIQTQGIIQPITLRKLSNDRYQLISGERRIKAAKVAGLTEIPAYIRVANDEQLLEMALVENIQREDLNPIEIAVSFQRLLEECQLKQEELSQRIGKDRSTISNYIRLLKLPVEIQLAIREKHISMGHARAMIPVEDASLQIQLLKKILAKNLSVRQVEELVRHMAESQPSNNHPASSLPEAFENAKESLHTRLQTPVTINVKKNGSGTIHITFSSQEELNRIISNFG